jgi:hypothetical protein
MCCSILLFVIHLCTLENAEKDSFLSSRSREVISDGFGPRYRVLVSGPKTVSITSLVVGYACSANILWFHDFLNRLLLWFLFRRRFWMTVSRVEISKKSSCSLGIKRSALCESLACILDTTYQAIMPHTFLSCVYISHYISITCIIVCVICSISTLYACIQSIHFRLWSCCWKSQHPPLSAN